MASVMWCLIMKWIGKGYQFNNSDTFSGEPTGPEEFLIQMVDFLGIIIGKRPKGRPRKKEN